MQLADMCCFWEALWVLVCKNVFKDLCCLTFVGAREQQKVVLCDLQHCRVLRIQFSVPSLGLLLVMLPTMAASTGIETSCDVPSVTIGMTATLTCRFTSNIQNVRGFTVDRNNPAVKDRDIIVNCDKYSGEFKCYKKEGYEYQYSQSQTTSIRVKILSAGVQHEGKYWCSTVGQDVQNIKSCNFTLKDVKPTPATFSPEPTRRGMHGDSTTTERSPNGGNGGSAIVRYIGIGVVVVLPLAGIVSFLLRKRLIRFIQSLPCFKGNTEGKQDHTEGANLPLRPTGVPPAAAEQRSEVTAYDEKEHVKLHHSDAESNDD